MSVISQALASFGVGAGTGNKGAWFTILRPASFRGVQFGVLTEDFKTGRRLAIHSYPYRDKPYAEDLGRDLRRFTLTGFIIVDDPIIKNTGVLAQRDKLVAACETSGPGVLIHPTMGRLTVSVESVVFVERWEKSRYIEVTLSCIESGDHTFPTISTSTSGGVLGAASAADAAAKADFATRALADLKSGAAAVGRVVSTAAAWARSASRLVSTATNLFHLGSTLAATASTTFSRFAGGRSSGPYSNPSAKSNASLAALQTSGAANRSAVGHAGALLNKVGSGLGL